MKSSARCNQHRHMGMTRLTKSGNDAEVTHHTNLRILKSQILFVSNGHILLGTTFS